MANLSDSKQLKPAQHSVQLLEISHVAFLPLLQVFFTTKIPLIPVQPVTMEAQLHCTDTETSCSDWGLKHITT